MPRQYSDLRNKTGFEELAEACPELKQLPKDWNFEFPPDDEDGRVLYKKRSEKTRESTYTHPTLGVLPGRWILRMRKDKTYPGWEYYDRDSKATGTRDPRNLDRNVAKEVKGVAEGLQVAAMRIRNSGKMDIRTLSRQNIKQNDIRGEFQIVHTIDEGDGSLGGMNGGVFVVRMHGLANRLFVEKRFKRKDVDLAKKEIEMLARVKHASLTFFMNAFILPDLGDASLYVEFCDRGSLEELMKAYSDRSHQRPKPNVPEAFVWHALIGLCDALAYLQTGGSHFRKEFGADRNWIPILHRDIKPDNVLLRSRSKVGSNAYFYCVLSDFGLACEDLPPNDYRCDYWQRTGSKCGTMPYLAPELLYNTYPRDPEELSYFPFGQRHTCKTDLWSLGATIFNLCVARSSKQGCSHITLEGKPPYLKPHEYNNVKGSRLQPLTIPSPYSEHLREAILRCTESDPRKRQSPNEMIKTLEHLVKESGHERQGGHCEPIPDWATMVHEYLSKAEQVTLQKRLSKKNAKPREPYLPPGVPFPLPPYWFAPMQYQLQQPETQKPGFDQPGFQLGPLPHRRK